MDLSKAIAQQTGHSASVLAADRADLQEVMPISGEDLQGDEKGDRVMNSKEANEEKRGRMSRHPILTNYYLVQHCAKLPPQQSST